MRCCSGDKCVVGKNSNSSSMCWEFQTPLQREENEIGLNWHGVPLRGLRPKRRERRSSSDSYLRGVPLQGLQMGVAEIVRIVLLKNCIRFASVPSELKTVKYWLSYLYSKWEQLHSFPTSCNGTTCKFRIKTILELKVQTSNRLRLFY